MVRLTRDLNGSPSQYEDRGLHPQPEGVRQDDAMYIARTHVNSSAEWFGASFGRSSSKTEAVQKPYAIALPFGGAFSDALLRLRHPREYIYTPGSMPNNDLSTTTSPRAAHQT